MPKSKWLDTLKLANQTPTKGSGHADAVYHRKQQNLALSLEDEAAENEDEWTYAKEQYGQDVEVVHTIELRQQAGIDACLRRKLDLSNCYVARMALRTPHVKLDAVHALQKIFPAQIASGIVQGGHVMNILGFDNFFLSVERGAAVFDIYMHDGRLDLKAYAGNYGGRGNLRPLESHYPLTVIETPEWIWTPEKP
jgi:hypothetical protein